MPQRNLIITKEEARKLLIQQIEKGRQLESKSVSTPEELQEYKRERARYTKYNIEMLTSMFGRDEDNFWRFKISSPADRAYFEDELEFYKELDAKQLDELIAIEESLDLIPVHVNKLPEKKVTDLPDKVSLAWLYHNVPYKFWLALIGALLTAFALGVKTGQTTFVQQLFGKDSKDSQRNSSIQATGVHIEGTVKRNGMGPLSDVEVTVSNDKKQVVYSTFTDDKGNYTTPSLQPSDYILTFKYAHYETVSREVDLKDQTVYLNVALDYIFN